VLFVTTNSKSSETLLEVWNCLNPNKQTVVLKRRVLYQSAWILYLVVFEISSLKTFFVQQAVFAASQPDAACSIIVPEFVMFSLALQHSQFLD
jgi:hypothetical protein